MSDLSCPWCLGDGLGDHAADCARREVHPLDPFLVDAATGAATWATRPALASHGDRPRIAGEAPRPDDRPSTRARPFTPEERRSFHPFPSSSGSGPCPLLSCAADVGDRVHSSRLADEYDAASRIGRGDRLMTTSEVAEHLYLHVNTVKRLGDRGELKFIRVCRRGDRRYRREDVAAYLAAMTS